MWIPQIYRADQIPTLHGFMKQYNFANIVSYDGHTLHSTPIPFILKPEEGPYGTLVAHIARANLQSKILATGQEAMVLFQGPHAYISPNWYQNRETAVPTWDHTTVCAYGVPIIIQEQSEVLAALRALVEQHEASFDKPWTPEEAPAYVSKLLPIVVAFQIPITRLEGQFKLSQDRAADQPAIIDSLERSTNSGERELAQMMQAQRTLQLQLNKKS